MQYVYLIHIHLTSYSSNVYIEYIIIYSIYMNKKKIWLSGALVVLVGTTAAVGTFAYFSATRTVTTSKFTTGTLDLNVASNGSVLEPFVIENLGANANIDGTKTWTITNTGSLPGKFLVRLKNVANKENGCNDQEASAEPACAADTLGELGNVINLKLTVDNETTPRTQSTLATANENVTGLAWNAAAPIIMESDDTKTVTASWAVGENDYGNEIQSDSVEFDMNFRLLQIINGPTPTNN